MPLSSSASGSYFYPVMQRPMITVRAAPATFGASGTFIGDAYSVVLSGTYIGAWGNVTVSIINNSVNNLKSGSIEVSPNDVNWIVLNTSIFSPLTSSGMAQYSMTGSNHQMLRVRVWPSGSTGALTGSVQVIVNVSNNG